MVANISFFMSIVCFPMATHCGPCRVRFSRMLCISAPRPHHADQVDDAARADAGGLFDAVHRQYCGIQRLAVRYFRPPICERGRLADCYSGIVSIPFHQIMRSTCPVFAVLIYRVRYHRAYSTNTYLSLIPVVAGVGLATYGDYYFTLAGFSLTLLGVVLAAVKVYHPRIRPTRPEYQDMC